MATIRSYTTIEQSKVLAKILPLESADMSWVSCDNGNEKYFIAENRRIVLNYEKKHWIPCWSFAALLSILPNYQLQTQDDGIGILCSCNGKFNIVTAVNPVDACVAMIEKLHELKIL